MMTFYLYTIFLLLVVFGFLIGVAALIEWRRADIEDYQRRFLNKHKNTYHNAQEKKKEHD